ncbi:M3 family oligoendopeptidase [Deinococcus roseus]|nr:M3 family oligoendopeptidase [Deinococcus roseus]
MPEIENSLLQDAPIAWGNYQSRYQHLIDGVVNPEDITQFLLDWSDLETELDQVQAVRTLRAHLDTRDEAAQTAYREFMTDIHPERERVNGALKQKLLSLDLSHLPADAVRLVRRFQADARLFREENIKVQMQLSELEQEYTQINAALKVDFRGEKLGLPQLAPFLLSPDRQDREEAWKASRQTFREAAPVLDDLFLRMLKLRRLLACNAGYASFRDYMWDKYHRFDYNPQDCLNFHQTIETEVVPFALELLEQHRERLGLEVLRPWDAYWYDRVDPPDCAPLQPFKTAAELVARSAEVFSRLNPRLAEMFQLFRDHKAMDLEVRENKLSQAYCTSLPVSKLPFVFQQVVGTAGDVSVFLHESGHAFHDFLSMHSQRFYWNHMSSSEFIEVPSTAMELITLDALDPFFDPQEMERVKGAAIWQMVHNLPHCCFLDAFQHWVYSEAPEDVTIEMLDQKALELLQRFRPVPAWDGFEADRKKLWHFFHVFYVPFYYIEYAFCGLGALQLWKNQQQDPEKTLQQYLEALEAGNSLSVPELYEKCGLNFKFDRQTVHDLMDFVRSQG